MITDLEWAPLAGRSFHMIASASKDHKLIIWRALLSDIMTGELLNQPIVQPLQVFELGGVSIQRIKWNILGTCCATAGDDGDVRLY